MAMLNNQMVHKITKSCCQSRGCGNQIDEFFCFDIRGTVERHETSCSLWLCQQFAIENGPVEIVDFPMKNGDFP